MYEINETHDPELMSWVESANDPNSDFPIQNLPFCRFIGGAERETIGIVIGDSILDFHKLRENHLFRDSHGKPFLEYPDCVFPIGVARNIRSRISEMLSIMAVGESRGLISNCLKPLASTVVLSPVQFIGDYTDFYCSIYHATNVGSMFRPDNPLMPNYKYVPIGYHGRASSIVVSGTDVKRPKGQNRSDAEKPPVFGPAKNLDYEMELGVFVGRGNELGRPIPISEAEEHIFGVCLVNDWSARDIQAWEYQPLGPFLAKNFATTISPYVVTMEALAPFRTAAFERDANDPQPLEYLSDEQNKKFGGLDINLEVYIQTEKMRNENIEPHLLSRSNTKDLYWTIGQMLTHHASNGCNLQTGDLMATGTVSGKEKHERGSMLELSWRGKEPIDLPSGEQRRFLEDGDEVIMKGFCEREGFRRIGLGECRGRILPAE
jgi:fumarylacetoacetase